MISKESYGFNTYAANRIGEIQEGTKSDEPHWAEVAAQLPTYAVTDDQSMTPTDTTEKKEEGPKQDLTVSVMELPPTADTETKQPLSRSTQPRPPPVPVPV